MKHVPPPTGEPLDASLVPSDITAQDLPVAIGRLRKEARDEIDRLIGFLDKTDDYMFRELEDAIDDNPHGDEGEAEPSLGWTEQEARWGKHAWSVFIDEELDRCDDEPSLGALPSTDQTGWEKHGGDDREGDGCADDREGDDLQHGGEGVHENDEPSLGWTDGEAAEGRTYAGTVGESADLEEGHGPRRPQERTVVDRPPLTVENTYRRFLSGLPANQKAALQARLRPDGKVLLR
jgi:hypothetical protein